MDQNEKAYYLKDLELALFLSLKGMKELYGFRMKHIQDPKPELIYQTIFELKKENLLYVQKSQSHEKEQIMINPDLDQILDNIKNAEKILLYFNRQSEHPDRCIYLGDKAVLISASGMSGNMNLIENVAVDALPETVCECGFCIEELLNDKSIYQEEEIEDPKLQEKADALFDKDFGTLDKTEWGSVTDCLRLISVKSRKCIKQYLLIKERLNDYFTVTDKEGSHVFMYSKKKVMDTLRTYIYER